MNRPQNRTEKVPNVTSGTLTRTEDLRELMRDTRRLLPLLLLTEEYQKHLPAPKQQGTAGRTGHRIAPKKCLTWLLQLYWNWRPEGTDERELMRDSRRLLPLLLLLMLLPKSTSRHQNSSCCCCCWQKSSKSTSRHQNSKARKDKQAT